MVKEKTPKIPNIPDKKNRVDEFAKNPKKALYKLAFPIIIGMVVQILYNIIDTAWVGRLGADAIAALTFSFPLFFILIALNVGIGVGMSSRISRQLGAKQKEGAENTAMHGLYFSLGVSLFAILLGFIFLKPLFVLFGAEGNVFELSIRYMAVILGGSIFMFFSFAIGQIFNAQGDTKTGTTIQVVSVVINIILDPIFIYVLGFGVVGAAIATVISFIVGLVLGLIFLKKKSYLRLGFEKFKYGLGIVKDILKVGFPASLMLLSTSFYVMFLNKLMVRFGVDYLAAYGLVWRLSSVVTMPMVAISIATMTIVGMFYGAKKYGLLREVTYHSIRLGVVFGFISAGILFIFPSFFLRIFTSDPVLLGLGSTYMRVEIFMFPFLGIGLILARVMQGMGYGFPGLMITIIRTLLISVPLAYFFVLVLGYGYLSVAVAMIIGGTMSSAVAWFWVRSKFAKLPVKK